MYATLNKQKWYKIKISDQSCKMSDEFINVEVTLLLGFHFTWIKSNQLLGCNYTDTVDTVFHVMKQLFSLPFSFTCALHLNSYKYAWSFPLPKCNKICSQSCILRCYHGKIFF